ncbi:MAG: CatB-related O-acetyltransferase [Dehalococcoidia bacterium]|nr:CatB-related O-acetyltransferase [Dehalococcoidia bacterium]
MRSRLSAIARMAAGLVPFRHPDRGGWPPPTKAAYTRHSLKGPLFPFPIGELKGPDFEVGEYTYGLPTVYPGIRATLRIGKFCSIAEGVKIDLGWGHRVDLASTYPFWAFGDDWPNARLLKPLDVLLIPQADVVIGNDVWIGRDSLILAGVRVGDGAVIGARSVVTKNVDPYCIVAGNPAKLIRKRFDDKTIERLLELRWWDWPPEKINENMHLICSEDLEPLLSATEEPFHTENRKP